MKKTFDDYLNEAEDLSYQIPNQVDEIPDDTSTPETDAPKSVADSYQKIKQQAETTEKKMNELYTIIDGMSKDENSQFMSVYNEFSKLLLEFQDMVITIQQVINDGK